MKRILFVAPHSFPIKSSESICNSKVAYVLAEAGYMVDVYTCSDDSTYPMDEELDLKLRSSKNLHVTSIKPDYLLKKSDSIWKILRSTIYNLKILLKTTYFYNGISIPYLILRKVREDMRKHNYTYDAIITRGFHTDLVGIYFSKKHKIKWIANWNDPYPLSKFPAPYGKGYDAPLPFFEQRIYNDIQRNVSLHSFPNYRLRDYMLKCFNIVSREKTIIIPHMALSLLKKENKKNSNAIRLVHCGSCMSPRNPKHFLYALSKVVSEVRQEIECFFIGQVDAFVNQLVIDLQLSNIVTLLPSRNYKDSVEFISNCDISLIIEAECEEGIYLPTKVVDSFQCGVPIFAISPSKGVLRDIIESHNVGYYAENTSVENIAKKIKEIINDFNRKTIPKITKQSIPEMFEDEILKTYLSIV